MTSIFRTSSAKYHPQTLSQKKRKSFWIHSENAGYTLAEMMVVVAIVGVLFVVGPSLLTNTQNFFLQTSARNDVERDARQSLDIINRLLRESVGSSIVIDSPSGQGPYSRITFQTVDGRNISIYQSGGNLYMSLNSNVSVLSKNVAYVAFTFPETDIPTIVSVSLTMSKAIQLGRKQVLELTIQKVRIMN